MNDIQLFKNERFGEVRVAGTSEEPLFCLADICKAVELQNPSSVKSRLDEEDLQIVDLHALNPNTQIIGNSMATFVNETGFYEVLLFSSSPKVKQFRRWITKEVLRAILVANETITRQKKQIEEAKKQISVLSPKAELMDRVMDTDQKIDIGQAAKILQLPFGRNTLFKKLKEKGVFFTNRNEPKQEYIKRGYFELKEKWIDRDNHDGFMVVKVLVTQKGLDFIAKIFDVVKHPKQMAMIL